MTKAAESAVPAAWACIGARALDPLAPGRCTPDILPALARATSPAFAAWAGNATMEGDTESRLYQKFRRVGAVRLAAAAWAAGHPVTCLKGVAVAHTAYPEPDLRPMADLDLLVAADRLPALVEWLRRDGFAFAPAHSRSRWGLIGDASLRPMLAPDRQLNVDLHVQPDAWPMHLGLDRQRLAAAAGTVETEAGAIPVPSPTHQLLLAASHAARDLFALDTAKNLIDGIMLLQRLGGRIDWAEAETIIAQAGLERGIGVYFALVASLAGDIAALPRRWHGLPAGVAPGRFAALREAFERGDTATKTLAMPAGEKLRREWFVAAGPRVSLGRWRRRLIGLVAPASGLPRGQAG